MMNSSTGFKKRSLLRPPSGILSSTRQFLKAVDISQSEPIIASNIRTEVAVIQQQINVLDKDKRIRNGESSLQKSYVLSLKKWLRDSQGLIQKEDDDSKILRQLGVDNYESGFRKLWKITSNLDLILSKMTQLQIVQFLKYDQMFEGVSQDSSNGQRILQTISKTGFSPSNFHLAQISLQRQISLFEVVSQLKRANSNVGQGFSSSKGFLKARDDTSELIEQLRAQNKKLCDLLQSIQKQQQTKTKIQPLQEKKNEVIRSGSPKDVFTELQDKYRQEISDLNNKLTKLNNQLSESKIQCNQYEVRLKAAEDELKGKQFSLGKKPASGSYQQALLEQMDKMKKGFEKKIQKILEEFSTKQREMRKKQYDYKSQNQKIKWEKGLLLKKFEALSG